MSHKDFMSSNGLRQVLSAVVAKNDLKYSFKVDSVTSRDTNIIVDNTDAKNPVIQLNTELLEKIEDILDRLEDLETNGIPSGPPIVTTAIQSVAIFVTAPVENESPDISPNIPVGSIYTVAACEWDPTHSSFEEDGIYTFAVNLNPTKGYGFDTNNPPTATVNNSPANVVFCSSSLLRVTFTFPQLVSQAAGTSWIMKNSSPGGKTLVNSSADSGRFPLPEWEGYSPAIQDDFGDDWLYPEDPNSPEWLVDMNDPKLKIHMYSKHITDIDPITGQQITYQQYLDPDYFPTKVFFDNFGNGTSAPNKVQRWGWDSDRNCITIQAVNSTSNPIYFKLVKTP